MHNDIGQNKTKTKQAVNWKLLVASTYFLPERQLFPAVKCTQSTTARLEGIGLRGMQQRAATDLFSIFYFHQDFIILCSKAHFSSFIIKPECSFTLNFLDKRQAPF